MKRLNPILRPLLLLLFVVAALPAGAQGKGKKINYEQHVKPILQTSCFNCHNADKTKGGVDLTSYGALLRGGSSGEIVFAKDPGDSILLGVMNHSMSPKMPPKGGKVSDKDLAIIKQWIEQGLRETRKGKAKVRKKPKVDLSVGKAAIGRPKGPAIMPRSLPLGPIHHTPRPGAVDAIAGHPWSPLVAIAGQKQVLIYHTQSGELLGVLPYDAGQPETLRFSWTGKLLMVGGGVGGKSGTVVLYDVETGNEVTRVGNEVDAVLASDLDPTQKVVALGGPSKLVKGYSVATGEMIYKIDKHTDWVTAIAFSPDGKHLATGDRNGGLHIWEADSGMPVFSLDGHKDEVTALSWRYDGKVLASSGEDGLVQLWEMNNGSKVKSWSAHSGGARSVAFGEDNKLVTTGRDQRVKVWDANGRRLQESHPFKEPGLSAAFDTTGKFVIAGDLSGKLVRWTPEAKTPTVEAWASNPPTIELAVKQSAERVSAANKALGEAKAFADGRMGELKKASAALASAQKKHAEARASVPAAEKALKQREQDRKDAQKKRDEAYKAGSAARNAANKAKYAVKAAESQVGRAKRDLDRGARELKQATDELSKASARAQEAAKQAKARPDDANAARRAKELAGQVAAMQKRTAVKAKALDAYTAKLAAAEKAVAAKKKEYAEKTKQEAAAKKKYEDAKKAYNQSVKAISDARRAIGTAQRSIKPAEQQVKAAADKRQGIEQAYKKALAKLGEADQAYQQTLREQAKWKAAGVRQQLGQLKQQLGEAKESKSSKRASELERQIEALNKRLEALRSAASAPKGGSQ